MQILESRRIQPYLTQGKKIIMWYPTLKEKTFSVAKLIGIDLEIWFSILIKTKFYTKAFILNPFFKLKSTNYLSFLIWR